MHPIGCVAQTKMNKRGKAVVEILVLLIVVVTTSVVVLLLVKGGVLSVRADAGDQPILNTEFIPFGRGGSLVIKEIKFCSYVDEEFNCLRELKDFTIGSDVHVWVLVESSPYDGNVMLVSNYQIKNPSGEIVLEVDESNNFHFDLISDDVEPVVFTNYFTTANGASLGEHTLNIIIENPLLNKKVIASRKFTLR
jgi:hypothetical protein